MSPSLLRLLCLQMWFQMVYSPKYHTMDLRLSVPSRSSHPSHTSLDKTIITDASLLGWGAHMGEHKAQGTWTPQEFRMHINILELRAVRKTWQAILPLIHSHHSFIMSDNTTTACYINKWGHEVNGSVLRSMVHHLPDHLICSLSPRDIEHDCRLTQNAVCD